LLFSEKKQEFVKPEKHSRMIAPVSGKKKRKKKRKKK